MKYYVLNASNHRVKDSVSQTATVPTSGTEKSPFICQRGIASLLDEQRTRVHINKELPSAAFGLVALVPPISFVVFKKSRTIIAM